MRPLNLLSPLALALAITACTDGADKDDSDTDRSTTDEVTSDDTDVTGETDTDSVDTDALCWVADDVGECWECSPPTVAGADSLPFLNACDNGTTGVAFDNATRIPTATWTPGTPLPAVP